MITRYANSSNIFAAKDIKLTVLTAGIVGEVMKALEPTASRDNRASLYMIDLVVDLIVVGCI